MIKPNRCQWRGINAHRTRDAVTFSDAAAEQSAVAVFRKGHNATCRCMAEEGCTPEECDSLYITDENGAHWATLQGAALRARQLQNGSIAIYRASVQTGDAAIDRAVGMIRERLAEVNRRNAEFWRRKDE
jgi:hypothetical protein